MTARRDRLGLAALGLAALALLLDALGEPGFRVVGAAPGWGLPIALVGGLGAWLGWRGLRAFRDIVVLLGGVALAAAAAWIAVHGGGAGGGFWVFVLAIWALA
ncbi:MAG TPA: hypothetical protein VJJ77_11545, partial [Dongiaceae bacterium]|nr:hypothetical protein [Dongiaceae bacterium]